MAVVTAEPTVTINSAVPRSEDVPCTVIHVTGSTREMLLISTMLNLPILTTIRLTITKSSSVMLILTTTTTTIQEATTDTVAAPSMVAIHATDTMAIRTPTVTTELSYLYSTTDTTIRTWLWPPESTKLKMFIFVSWLILFYLAIL